MAVVSIENSSSYGELERGVGVRFLELFDQTKLSYSSIVDNKMTSEGNKMMSGFCKKIDTKDQVVHFLQKTGFAYPSVFAEGAAIPQDSRLLGYKTSMTPQFTGDSVTVTKRAIQDRDYQAQMDEFKDLGIAMQEKMDRDFFANFNNAFTAQSSLPSFQYGYGDGKPLGSTLHPRKDGGSAQSNASSTGLVLNEANLETGRLALRRAVDDRGKPINAGAGGLILLVPLELEKTACEIAKSSKKVQTNNNNINVYEGLITVISSAWIGESGTNGVTTQWHLIDPKLSKLHFVQRQGVETHTATDANTLNKTFYAHGRWATGWSGWIGTWHSKGDGQAYSS